MTYIFYEILELLYNIYCFNRKTTGVGSVCPPPCGFPKNVSPEERVKPWCFSDF